MHQYILNIQLMSLMVNLFSYICEARTRSMRWKSNQVCSMVKYETNTEIEWKVEIMRSADCTRIGNERIYLRKSNDFIRFDFRWGLRAPTATRKVHTWTGTRSSLLHVTLPVQSQIRNRRSRKSNLTRRIFVRKYLVKVNW